MRKLPYLPQSDAKRAEWLENFALKKEEHMGVFGFSQASVDSTKKDAIAFRWSVNVLRIIRDDSKQFTAYKNLLRDGLDRGTPEALPTLSALTPPVDLVAAGVFTRAGKEVAFIKNHINYSTAYGKDFGIIGAASSFNPFTFKTTLRLQRAPAGVEVRFIKKALTGIQLYYRLQGTSGWIKIGLILKSGWIHRLPLAQPATPEVREYMARGVIDNEEVGPDSDIVAILVAP